MRIGGGGGGADLSWVFQNKGQEVRKGGGGGAKFSSVLPPPYF